MRVWYLPIEAYTERYTTQLLEWTHRAFGRHGLDSVSVMGADLESSRQIGNAGPLDFIKRPHYSASQVMRLMDQWAVDPPKPGDVVYFDDMFTPGFEAVPYYLDLHGLSSRVPVYARNHAGTADIFDYVYPSRRWMRHYELMAANACDAVICASQIHAELMAQQGIENVEVLGLPFDKDEVTTYQPVVPFKDRIRRVLFASRWDVEKNPQFFIDLACAAKTSDDLKDVEFVIATGKKELRSNDPALVGVAREAAAAGVVKIAEGLTKAQYYALVSTAKVQFNCAFQDFVSYTLLEASAYGTPTVAPCYRSFPEVLPAPCLYVPQSIESALDRLRFFLNAESPGYDVGKPATFHHATLDRICTMFSSASQLSSAPSATPAVSP